MPSVLLVSPHPDDEVIGVGGTVAWLIRNGWTVTNLACSLGRPADHERRRAELERAAERLEVRCEVLDPPVGISAADDLRVAEAELVRGVTDRLDASNPDVVIAPSPQDLHHGHEVVGRAVRAALEVRPGARWWQYAVWGDLPFPTLYVPLETRDTERALYALGAYGGENARNDYRDLLSGGWIRNRSLGAEKVFGFGAGRPVEARAVELIGEVVWDGNHWRLGPRRVLIPEDVVVDPGAERADDLVRAGGPSVLRPHAD